MSSSSSSRYLMAPHPPKRVLLRNTESNSTGTGALNSVRRGVYSRENRQEVEKEVTQQRQQLERWELRRKFKHLKERLDRFRSNNLPAPGAVLLRFHSAQVQPLAQEQQRKRFLQRGVLLHELDREAAWFRAVERESRLQVRQPLPVLFLILYLFHHLSPLPLVPAPFPRCWKPGHLPDASGMLGLTRLLVRNSPFRNTQLGRYTYSLPSVHWQVTFRALEILKVLSLARIPTITTTVTSPPSFVASPGPSFDV
jgi:hypothetical protein